METTPMEGLRVIRGRDWRGDQADGGEGYVGTVVGVHEDTLHVQVLWDMGQDCTSRAGSEGKCDLRVFDTAQIGVCHQGKQCHECGERDICGMVWRCQQCPGCDLCTLCYSDDKHDIRHGFLRIDSPDEDGQPVPPRKSSVKIRAIGLFPGALVTRGRHWEWGDQDGGQGSEGEVKGYMNVSPGSARNLVSVQWQNGSTETYRFGFRGHVDLTCVEEEVGPFYYRDHLPLLDLTKTFPSALPNNSAPVASTAHTEAPPACTETTTIYTEIPPTRTEENPIHTAETSSSPKDPSTCTEENLTDTKTTVSNGTTSTCTKSTPISTEESPTCTKLTTTCTNASPACAEEEKASSGSSQKLDSHPSSPQAEEYATGSSNGQAKHEDKDSLEAGIRKATSNEQTMDRSTVPVDGSRKETPNTDDTNMTPADTEKVAASSPREEESPKAGEEATGDGGDVKTFHCGDKVALVVSAERLAEFQKGYGGCTAGMRKAVGGTGEVVEVVEAEGVFVRFHSNVYKFHPAALIRVPKLAEGNSIRIRESEEEAKVLNTRVGWKEEMRATLGKVGRVLKIDEDGDVLVSFGRHLFLFAPASCLPASGMKPDSLRIEPGGNQPATAKASAGVSFGDKKSMFTTEAFRPTEPKKNESADLYRQLRERIQIEERGVGGEGRGDIRRVLEAVKNGDHRTVRALCTSDMSLLEQEHRNLTPLILACARGTKNLQVVKTLLQLGANVDHGLLPNRTPLYAALEGHSEEVVDLLLKSGADPFALDTKCHTYLHIAAAFQVHGAIRELVSRGVDVNQKDDQGDTPLHYAVEHFHNDSVATLLKLDKTDLEVGDTNSFTALHLACHKGNARGVELILEHDKNQVNVWLQGKTTALHLAAQKGHDECIRVLVLFGGSQLNIRDKQAGYTPLHLAAILARFRAVEALLELGADLHIQDFSGDTPLHLSVGGRQERDLESEAGEKECQMRVAIACMLISNGAYVDVENRAGRSPLTYGVPPVRDGVKRFVRHNPELVKKKGEHQWRGSSSSRSYRRDKFREDASSDPFLPYASRAARKEAVKNLEGPIPASAAQGHGQLKEALKGVGLPCGLCGRSQSDVTLQPCQHKCVCSTCSVKVTTCPLCDAQVTDKVVTGFDGQTIDVNACKAM